METQIEAKKISLNGWESRLQNEEYNLHIKIIQKAHCNKAFTIGMEKEFWESELKNAILKGKIIGKSETKVKGDVCYALVSIYQDLEMWDKAYLALCIQAENHPWIHAFTIEQIVKRASMGAGMKAIIEKRLQTSLLPELREQLQQGLDFLKRMGY